MRPSFWAQVLGGILLFLTGILWIIHSKEFDVKTTIMFGLLASIAIGVHGLMHHWEEIFYDFNPLEGHWKVRDNPVRCV
jgi:hypothetical protein